MRSFSTPAGNAARKPPAFFGPAGPGGDDAPSRERDRRHSDPPPAKPCPLCLRSNACPRAHHPDKPRAASSVGTRIRRVETTPLGFRAGDPGRGAGLRTRGGHDSPPFLGFVSPALPTPADPADPRNSASLGAWNSQRGSAIFRQRLRNVRPPYLGLNTGSLVPFRACCLGTQGHGGFTWREKPVSPRTTVMRGLTAPSRSGTLIMPVRSAETHARVGSDH